MTNKKECRIIDTISLTKSGILIASTAFKTSSLSTLLTICNGCGAADAKFDFVPDRIYGTYIGYACHIHDFEYSIGTTNKDRKRADKEFRKNLYKLIDLEDKPYKPKPLMKFRARVYYTLVRWRGGSAFWAGKN